jgi:hypothetical protein
MKGGTAQMDFRVEDWWDVMTGGSWMFADGNPAAMNYAIRSASVLPLDNEVVYGKDTATGLGHLVHVSELVVDA